jgi:hypothetical protein
MPDDRLSHPRIGRSHKVSQLDHLEYRVWDQYRLSADDYGVMPESASLIRGANLALEREPEKRIQQALSRLVELELVHRFEHQGVRYVYSRNWQKHQKVRYPRETHYPRPPDDDVCKCEGRTAEMFLKRSGNVSEINPESSSNDSAPPVRAPAGNANANANATSECRGELERGISLTVGQLRHAAVALASLWNQRAAEPFMRIADDLGNKAIWRIEAALREHPDLGWWETQIVEVMASSFCRGGGDRGWVADFWWLLEHATEVSTGRYRDRAGAPRTKADAVTQANKAALAGVLARRGES